MSGTEALWDDFLESVRPTLSSHVLDTWLRPVRCTRFAAGTATLEVRDQFFRDWLTDHYVDFIQRGLSALAGEAVTIAWSVNPAMGGVRVEQSSEQDTAREQNERAHTVAESLDDGAEKRRPLNRRYLFDSFVCGPSNQFAFAACKAVAENPGHSYNPLFIFGGVGLGKTHLLSAIGHQILTDNPRANIIYTSSEQFTNEVINAVLGSKLEDFRSKYRSNCDVILIDDIQLIAGKERTQHEFFHIFNTLYDSQRQIVVTSDKLPHEIPEIEERLRNRFQWGLIADVQPPEIETRIAILRKKATNEKYALPDEVAFFLAKNIRSNVRELEGALVRIMAHASLTGTPLSIDYARNILSDILSNRSSQVSVEAIQKIVCGFFQLRLVDLKSHRRLKALVRPRQVAMYLSRKHTTSSFPELGSRFGDKDHTTVMSACNRIEALMEEDAQLRSQVSELERQLDVVNR
ncbi:MAG: chromosomal replication initiator protein DnaA [Deltaproteobacteria bacterium]|nr:MAG: chromosomal replication initiator protein DnaA [Deltaproteobacteria bacterium]